MWVVCEVITLWSYIHTRCKHPPEYKWQSIMNEMDNIDFGYLIMIWTTDMHFEIFMVVGIQIMFFWVMTLCHLVGGNQHFGGTCSLYSGSGQQFDSEDRGRMFLHSVGMIYETTWYRSPRVMCSVYLIHCRCPPPFML